jgi:hypothetical protein
VDLKSVDTVGRGGSRRPTFRVLVGLCAGAFLVLSQSLPASALWQTTSAQCAGVEGWLSESEARFLPAALLDDDGLNPDEGAMAYRDAVLEGQRGQANSSPPVVAEGLNSQILATFALAVGMTERVLAGGDIATFEEDFDAVAVAVNRTRSMARELKRECHLTESGAFFDAPCHGVEAAEWYSRSSLRGCEVAQLVADAKKDALEPLTVTEEAALLRRLANGISAIGERQRADTPPPQFQTLHELYLRFFETYSRLFAQAMTADEGEQLAGEAAAAEIGQSMNRERARLDLSCN